VKTSLPVQGLRRDGAKTLPMCFDLVASIRSARGPMINDLWYKNAVIYCLSVGTYMDSNGHGVEDLPARRRHPALKR
jgi:hypothetical protein